MRNRLIVLAAGLVFAASVASVAVVAGRGDDGTAVLEKLPIGAAGGGDAAIADRQAAATSSEAMSLIAPVSMEYRLSGPLPELASTAPAYRLTAMVTVGDVKRLARALGLQGEVVEQPERFVVRSGEVELAVERQPGLPWYLGQRLSCPDSPVSSDAGVSVKCAAAAAGSGEVRVLDDTAVMGITPPVQAMVPGAEPAVAMAKPVTAPGFVPGEAPCPLDVGCGEPPIPPVRPTDLPTRAAAEAQARALFTTLGVGLESFELSDGFDAWYASVQPQVGGLSVGWSTSATIGPKGQLRWASGFLATPERIGDYPLAGTTVGFERLKAGAAGGGWFAYGGDGTTSGGTALDTRAVPEAVGREPAVGTDIATDNATDIARVGPTEPFVQTITGARLALQFLGDRLVPVYQFLLADGGWVEAPAVVDELLEDHQIVDR